MCKCGHSLITDHSPITGVCLECPAHDSEPGMREAYPTLGNRD